MHYNHLKLIPDECGRQQIDAEILSNASDADDALSAVSDDDIEPEALGYDDYDADFSANRAVGDVKLPLGINPAHTISVARDRARRVAREVPRLVAQDVRVVRPRRNVIRVSDDTGAVPQRSQRGMPVGL